MILTDLLHFSLLVGGDLSIVVHLVAKAAQPGHVDDLLMAKVQALEGSASSVQDVDGIAVVGAGALHGARIQALVGKHLGPFAQVPTRTPAPSGTNVIQVQAIVCERKQ